MLTRTTTLTTVLAVAGAVAAGDTEPAWELIRPTNTGIPGDYTHHIFIDDHDNPWICGYIPFWEEGGVGYHDGQRWRVLGNVDCPQVHSPRFNDIVREDNGVMWIGTDDGLLRFDAGAEPWCVTRFDSSNSPLDGNQIVALDLAPDGTLWIANQEVGGPSNGGLGHYDPVTGEWEFWNTSNGLPWWAGWDWVDYVSAVPDPDGGYTVWFGSREMGLTAYKDGLFIWYNSPTPPDLDPLPTGIPGTNSVDENGALWMTTDSGIARRNADGSFLIVGAPDGLTTEISRVETISGGRALLGTFHGDVYLWDGGWIYIGNWGSGNHTYSLVEDSQGNFWAGGIGGASKYENGFWQRRRLTNSGMISFFIETLAFDEVTGDVFMNGNAAPGVGGFDILHPDRTWTNVNTATYGLGIEFPFPTDDTAELWVRQNGRVLVAPNGGYGLHELDRETETYTALISTGYPIETITEDGSGRVWAAGGGLFLVTGPDEYERFTFDNSPLPGSSIVDVIPDPTDPNTVYVATPFGVARTDGQSWTVWDRTEFGLTQDSLGHHVTDFDLAPDGTFWVGSGLGINHYDPRTGINTRYDLNNTSLPSDDVHNVEVAPNGDVWISMFDHVWPYPGGVARFDGQTWAVWKAESSPLPHNQVWDLASRPTPGGDAGDYELWIATASEAVAVVSITGDGVPCRADWTGDGVVNAADVGAFLSTYFDDLANGTTNADFDENGVTNPADVGAFLSQYFVELSSPDCSGG